MPFDLRPPLDPILTAFGRAATVTPVGGAPVAADVIWDQEMTPPADQNIGGLGATVSRRLVAYVRRDQVATLPTGSTIVGGAEHNQKTWKVTTVDASDPDFHVAVMI